MFKPLKSQGFFLFGARGTGKSSYVRAQFPGALYFDLLDAEIFREFLSQPNALDRRIPKHHTDWVIVDEVQKIPALLDEVHRLIEKRKLKFVLTGSNARKLKRGGANLLAGRALTCRMYPLTALEIGKEFKLEKFLRHGSLPMAWTHEAPEQFLKSYVATYLKEEIQQEGLTRNVAAFARFLEAASFSQGQVLNITSVARDAAVERKVVQEYFQILDDLLLAYRLPVFIRRAKRRMAGHPKFYFFDVGVYRTLRPRGPLDSNDEIDGAACETAVLQEITALNDYFRWGYEISYWRTQAKDEVDFVLYGDRGLKAIEVKKSARVREEDLRSLKLFLTDYPKSEAYLLYGGARRYHLDGIEIVPLQEFFESATSFLE